MTGSGRTPGQVAYDAYGDRRAWRTFDTNLMPTWEDQHDALKAAWEAAAAAVLASAGGGVDSVGG